MTDFYAIGTAIADKFAAVTAPADTQGGTAIRSHSVGVQGVPVTPAIVVELPEGEVTTSMGSIPRRSDNDYHVYFLWQKASGDVPRDTKVMLQWLGPLLQALDSGNTLGIGSQSGWTLLKSAILSWEPGQYEVGGQPYHSWHFPTRVSIEEYVTVTP